uniref:F-box protein At3g26010-like beta-propeller domain-containing protein n=1 Tax=Tanacetum cinerariifolium TaxID=118510 RepID=A0A699JC51_TANCI|nr:hypothetical protein [Tanacetum cinerariifolium]
MAFPRLQEVAAAQNSNSLTDAMSVYIERKTNEDLHFTAGLSHLWEVLYSRVNEHRLLIAELNVFGGPLALQCAEFFKQLSQTEVLKILEIRKSIGKIWMIPFRLHLLLYYVHGEDEVRTWIPDLSQKKSSMDRSLTLGFTKEADNVKILQSCNGLLLCGGSGMPVFYYVYNPSTDQYKKLSYPDCSLDNSPYYSSAGLRITFDPTKSPYYKLVDAGRTFCDIDIQIYSSETGKWSLFSDRFNYFNFDHFDSAIYWNDGLHWLKTENRQLMHYSLNIEDPDHPIITTIPIPQRGMTFLKSYGYMDPMYRVHTNDFMTPLPECWLIRSNVWSIVLGEREQDSFLVIKLSGKIVLYNLISKTLHEIYDCRSNQVDDNHDDNDDDDELL